MSAPNDRKTNLHEEYNARTQVELEHNLQCKNTKDYKEVASNVCTASSHSSNIELRWSGQLNNTYRTPWQQQWVWLVVESLAALLKHTCTFYAPGARFSKVPKIFLSFSKILPKFVLSHGVRNSSVNSQNIFLALLKFTQCPCQHRHTLLLLVGISDKIFCINRSGIWLAVPLLKQKLTDKQ